MLCFRGVRKSLAPQAVACLLLSLTPSLASAQTPDTGAITGTVTDATGAAVPSVAVKVTSLAMGGVRTVESNQSGSYTVPLLPPGEYKVEVSKSGFKTETFPKVTVIVAGTETLNVKIEIGAQSEHISVSADAEMLQTASSAVGQVTDAEMVENLPLAVRNFTQIIGLNPGVAADLTDSTALGRGVGGERAFSSAGASQTSNNFQMNGTNVNDYQSSGDFSAGVPIPNPDTIEEFRVQTNQFDATSGRNAGAVVNVITKGGTNHFHGTAFEYLRNTDLDSNTFFFNETGVKRGLLKQNQFGGTLGGPVIKDKLFFFGSYQGTRQQNGVNSSCSVTYSEPPLTNNRSAAALGQLFAGQRGYYQTLLGNVGPAILADGSNISPQALALMNYKLPSGQYAISTPQLINPSLPFATQGTYSASNPCTFNEDQYMANGDYVQSARSHFSLRYFYANSQETETLESTNLGGATAPGWPFITPDRVQTVNLTHTFIISPSVLNQFQVGFNRVYVNSDQTEPMQYSQLGINAPSYDNGIPAIEIAGAMTLGGNGQSFRLAQNTFVYQDSLLWTRGRHVIKFGGGLTRLQNNVVGFHYIAGLEFETFPDLLLGLNATQSGTAAAGEPIGNVLLSIDLPGLFDRANRAWDTDVYVQDDYKITRSLTLNLGFRYERLGGVSDNLGRDGNVNPALINPTPPASGSLAGFVVPANYTGPVPTGVTRVDNNLGYLGIGQNTFNPRLGFAWRLPGLDRFVLRGGAGEYHDQPTGQPAFQQLTNEPFSTLTQLSGTSAGSLSLASPFAPAVTLPAFSPYTPSTVLNPVVIDPGYRPSTVYHYSLGLQTQLRRDLLLDIGYSGARGLHLLEQLDINQASLASPLDPIRGVTTNTVVNVAQRVPYQGFSASGFYDIGPFGESWYNALAASLSKRMSHGLQFLASYTFARALSTSNSNITGANGGTITGNQDSRSASYGPDSFLRDQRFILSAYYTLPWLLHNKSFVGQVLGGWKASSVVTIQSGDRISLTASAASNVYGVTSSRAQMVAGCTYPMLETSGSTISRLNDYLNKSCATTPPVVGNDGKATTFGNSGVGIVRGPGQRETDLALIKQFRVPSWTDNSRLEIRADFFNAFNNVNFGNPGASISSANFGQIRSTTGSPRLIQFAMRFTF